jgi:hypothetical protein
MDLAQGRAQAPPHPPAPGSDAGGWASGNTPTLPPMRRRIQPPAVRCRSRKPGAAATSVSDDPLLAQPLRIFGTGAAERTRQRRRSAHERSARRPNREHTLCRSPKVRYLCRMPWSKLPRRWRHRRP